VRSEKKNGNRLRMDNEGKAREEYRGRTGGDGKGD
jgi:hypothetical protein